jgi:endonuclease YncB( thermonuclease family)
MSIINKKYTSIQAKGKFMNKHYRILVVTTSLAIVVLVNAFPFFAHAADFRGKVVGVIDGDTIKVRREGKEVKILLAGIDCPEKKQPFGEKAKKFTFGLTYGQLVMVKEKTPHSNGSIVADIILPEGINLNQQLVWAGLAWWYRRKAPNDSVLSEMETKAQKAKRGLWADKSPIPPWEWRRGNRQDRVEARPAKVTIIYKGNIRARIFHSPSCRYYDCTACTVSLETRMEAINSGYLPCKLCKP